MTFTSWPSDPVTNPLFAGIFTLSVIRLDAELIWAHLLFHKLLVRSGASTEVGYQWATPSNSGVNIAGLQHLVRLP